VRVVRPTPDKRMTYNNTKLELSSLEETRAQFNGRTCAIKLGIDLHQEFLVVALQEGGATPKPAQRFTRGQFLSFAAKLRQQSQGAIYALYEACGFGYSLQRQLRALGIQCYVSCPQKLDERSTRVKTDARDAKSLCLKLSRYVEGNKAELALVRIPTEQEEQLRSVHRQREQLIRARKALEAQGRSLLVEHNAELPRGRWWKQKLAVAKWLEVRLSYWRSVLVVLDKQIRALTLELEQSATKEQARGLGKLSSVLIDREVCDWHRFKNRRQVASYTGLCPGVYSSGQTRHLSCITKHGNPRLRAALVETAWRLVRFQPSYRAVLKWRHLLGKGALATSPARKKAIVAVARELAIDLWRVRTGRVTLEQLGLTICSKERQSRPSASSRGTERNTVPAMLRIDDAGVA
jgi:transposase